MSAARTGSVGVGLAAGIVLLAASSMWSGACGTPFVPTGAGGSTSSTSGSMTTVTTATSGTMATTTSGTVNTSAVTTTTSTGGGTPCVTDNGSLVDNCYVQ